MRKISHGCTLDCFDCCKLNIYIENDEIIKVEGDKDHPYTKGFICKKGHSHLKRLNHSERIYKPLYKKDGIFEEITFNEAIDIIVDKLKDAKNKYGSNSVLYHEQYGNGAILKSIGEVFCNFYGGVSRGTGGPCWSAGIQAQKYDFGNSRSNSIEDMINSKTIIVWGKNPAFTTIHTMDAIKKAKKNGSYIIVIDPIFTATAKSADKYIRTNPGTDGALAIAITKVIIDNNNHDLDFIDKYIIGFNEYSNYLKTLSLEDLSIECGVDVKTIKEIAELYSKKPSRIEIGYGIQKYENGGNTIRAIDALGAISGQIGISGGGVNYANMLISKVINQDPYNSISFAKERDFKLSNISDFIEESIRANSKNPIKVAIITKSNLINQFPDINRLKKTFSTVDFKVCFDMFLTDTAKECDLFIPTTSTLESEDLLLSSMTSPFFIYNEKAIEPREELMDEYNFFMELARRLEIKEYPYVDKEEYMNKIIEPLKDIDNEISLEKLKTSHFTINEHIAWIDKEFKTSSGKIEIYSEKALKDGLTPIPTYIKSKKHGEFRLLTNHGRDSLSSQGYMDIESLAEAYINSKIAEKLNLKEGDTARLKSNKGEIKVKIKIEDILNDDVIMMYAGWWEKHGNPNFVTGSYSSEMGGQIAYNESFVNIEKV